MIQWQYFPKSRVAPPIADTVVAAFESVATAIDSSLYTLESNLVLQALAPSLISSGFKVESSKAKADKVKVPVLFGRNGRVEKSFDADAYHPEQGFVLEVEAGRGVVNNQFLKDLFQACMMHDVQYLGIAVRNIYRQSPDFEKVNRFFDTMYASTRLQLPLQGILVIGY
jgi:hypothetical protein